MNRKSLLIGVVCISLGACKGEIAKTEVSPAPAPPNETQLTAPPQATTNAAQNSPATNVITKPVYPFIGTRHFNFAGGSGTEESIQIKEDGTVILRSYGAGGSSGVNYKGKFTNPVPNGHEGYYLIKGNKIYWLGKNKKVEVGCRLTDDGTEKPCVETLTGN